MKSIINGKIITPYGIIKNKVLNFRTIINSISDTAQGEIIDAKGNYVCPGLVDIHIHGYAGEDASDGKAEGIRTMAEGIVKNGVTSWLPTTMTVSKAELEAAFEAIRTVKAESETPDFKGAQILGINAEGPFINAQYKGAQAEENIIKPDAEFIKKYADIIKLVTVAPEVEGAMDFIKEIKKDTSITVSMGHTGTTYETAKEAFEAGLSHVTHLFNAMTPLHHRKPGAVGAALSKSSVTCELICDTYHVHPGQYELVYSLKGDKLVLITDCIRAGGLTDGEYTLGGQKVTVKGITCLLDDGTIAGSVLKLNNAIKNFKNNTNIPLHKIVNCASLTPAKAIGVDKTKGSIEVGKDADIVIMDEDFQVLSTFVGGDLKYSK
ncbi:MAG: N-acetylglucosamine-6-phosphate deacetylase [Ruminococcaceae bacterium]|nr:N-acetylglucosamine-6-phosphate deacetylase [Oscillospiraceae bacterium]